MSAHDVVVLGGGPGGYAAALYGASAGLDVALVEEQKLGGTCLHRGCIPAKALLQAAEVARTVGEAGDFGIMPDGGFRADWTKINERKSGIVDRLCRGLTGLLGQRKVTVVNGRGRLTPRGAVAVNGTVLTGRGVIIATGSEPRSLPGYEFDGERIISSDHATNLPSLGQRAAVIGGGVVGCEFASVFADLGVTTTLLEMLPGGVLPVGPDPEVAGVLARSLSRRGVQVHAGARAAAPERTTDGLVIPLETAKGSEKIEVDHVLVSVGRRPVTADCGFADAGIALTGRGFVQVDPVTLATSRPGVYAVGDVIDTPGLAHVAYAEAIVAIGSILGERPVPVDYGKVPWIVYTHPEVSWVGMTETQARAAGYDVVVRRGHFAGNGRAMIVGSTDGLVKVISQRDGPLLGVHLAGPWASELLAESYLALNWQAMPRDIGALIHPHPSLSEAIGETMLALTGRSLHG
jgi:dihydrolipoamide dehydrogenase